jgi:CBS domain-containing protein
MDFHKSRPGRDDWDHEPAARARDRLDQLRERAIAAGRAAPPAPPRREGPRPDLDPRWLEAPLPTRHAWERGARDHEPGERLLARDVMTTTVAEVVPEATVLAVAELMRKEAIGIVPVVDNRRRPLGLITDRDIVVRLLAHGKDPANARARDVMSEEVECVDLEADVAEVIEKMARHRVRRVPVVDRNERIVGLVSLEDLVRRADVHEELQMLLARTAGRRSFWRGQAWR